MYDYFLGESIDYWLTLKERADCLDVSSLLKEIAELSSKVYFYEKRVNEMVTFRDRARAEGGD